MHSHRRAVVLCAIGMVLAGCTATLDEAPLGATSATSNTGSPTEASTDSPTATQLVDGWQSVDVRIGVEAEPIGMWFVDPGFVLATTLDIDEEQQLAVWRSHDGLEWVPEDRRGPIVGSRVMMDVANQAMVVVVDGTDGWDAVAVSSDGVSWQTYQPEIDWIPDGWRELVGFEYVHAGFEIGDIEVGPQGVAAVAARDGYVDFVAAIQDSMPGVVAPYEVIHATWNLEDGTVDVEGIRHNPSQEYSLCDVYRTHHDVASEFLGNIKLEDIGIDPVLATEVRSQAWSRMVWHSADLVSWSLDELVANDAPVHEWFGLLTDMGTGYTASLGGDLGYSSDIVEWTSSSRHTDDRYFHVDELVWTGQELVVAVSAHSPTGQPDDSYDIWTGSFEELQPLVAAPADRLIPGSFLGEYVQMAAGQAGIALVGSNSDVYPARSKVWILQNEDRLEHDLGYLSDVAPRAAVGTQQVVVVNTSTSATSAASNACETTLTIDAYQSE